MIGTSLALGSASLGLNMENLEVPVTASAVLAGVRNVNKMMTVAMARFVGCEKIADHLILFFSL